MNDITESTNYSDSSTTDEEEYEMCLLRNRPQSLCITLNGELKWKTDQNIFMYINILQISVHYEMSIMSFVHVPLRNRLIYFLDLFLNLNPPPQVLCISLCRLCYWHGVTRL